MNGIFNVYVSTDGGWAEAGGVTVRRSAGTGALTVKFVLGEDFPPTGACRAAVHGMDSEFPAVKLSLDTGAWAYPYTWLKEFMVGRVDIAVEVEGLSTLQVYNALGRVDDSRPFAPFGIDTEKGAWFVVGSRELAVKRAPVCDLRIRWQDLPDHPDGMAGYYAGYRSGITNRSFVLDTAFLEDYRWKTPEQSARHYLFATSVGQAGPRVGHSPGLSLQDTGTRHRGSLTAAPPGAGPGDAGGPEIIQPGVGLSDTGVCQTVSRTAAPPGAGIVGRVTTNAGLSHTSKPNIGPPYATPPYDGPPEMRLPETRLPETDCREGDLRDPEPAKAAPRDNAQAKAGLTEHSPGEAGLSETGISQSAPRESGPLAPESVISGIRLWETAPAAAADGPFGYDISSRGGFIRLRLAGPEAGFGGKLYRRLYAEGMRLKSLKKFPEPNAPYNPVAERMTLGYRSSVTVDLRRDPVAGSSVLWHTTPQGWRQVYPAEPAGSVPLVYGMGEAANLLFKLRAGAGSVVRLYFDLTPLTDKPNRPVPVRWYWGDGYRWEPVADGAILADTTANLTLSGILELKLPDRMDGDTIWLRAGIAGGYRNLPALKRIVTNVARLDAPRGGITPAMAAEGKVKPAKPVPGLRDIVSLTPSVSADDRSGRVYKMARTSEAVSHRGRAVTPRDYERLVLEEFPSVAEVKYIPPAAGRNRRDIALAVIPADPAPAGRGLGPKAGLDLIMRIEEFVRRVSSPYVENISVINPAYERVTVRCGIGFNGSVPYGSCRSRIKEICDRHIAPWYAEGGVPRFDHNIDSDALAAEIRAEGCVEWLRDLSLVTLSKEGRGRYYIAESRGRKEVVAPSRPYAVFVPAAEHTFHSGSPGDFGLEEMAVGGNFVIC